MALDSQHEWIVSKGEDDSIVDGLGRKRTAGVGIDNDRAILDTGPGGWRSLSDDAAVELGYRLMSAGMLIQQRRSGRS